MPRKSDNQSIVTQNTSEQSQSNTDMDMELEELNEERKVNKPEDIIPNLTGIEEETIEDKNGNIYDPEKFKECFFPQNDLAKDLTCSTLRFILAKKKYPDRSISIYGPSEIYIVNRQWYNKWKKYSKYGTMKRVIKAYSTYKERPIKYNPDEKLFPGEINNKDLLIRNKINLDERNILVSKYNDCLDTKLIYQKEKDKKDFTLLTKERFDLLNNHFKCDYILKANKIEDDNNKMYDIFSIHFRLIFIPTLALFKSVNEENIENFKKNQNIVYDIYFKQTASRKDFLLEFKNIFKEKPQILTNMGVDLNMENNLEELSKHFKFYKPGDNNTKNAKEIADFIFSNETIEKIKNDKKISDKELQISKMDYFNEIKYAFHFNIFYTKSNLDEVENGTILLEYNTLEDQQTEHLGSIFDIEINSHCSVVSYEHGASRGYHEHQYNLDNFPLNKEDNKYGLVGLNNLGNTCYMNTGLQCLSNCELLTKYFLGDYYKDFINKDNPIGSKGEIVEKYSQLIHHLWYGNNECISPIQFKLAFGKIYNAFNDFRQQDSQEFISYLLDALHEDLNKVLKKPYIETKDLTPNLSEEEQFKIQKDLYLCRNQSFIADLIYGFYKSTVFCPNENCKNIIKSFEPFNMITLSLVNEAQIRKMEEYENEQNKKLGIKIIQVTFVPFKINNRPLRFPVKIKKEMDIFTFKQKIEVITGFNKNTFEIYKNQSGEFCSVKPNIYLLEDFLKGETKIFLFQIPPYVFNKPLDYFDRIYDNLNNNNDKLFLEEEKYEGNDLYKEYNKKQKKCRTDDDIERNANPNRINLNGMVEDERDRRVRDDSDKENNNVMNTRMRDFDDINNHANNINANNINEDQDVEMKDETLNESFNIDRNQWIKCELYNYSYSDENGKDKKYKEKRIDNSRIIYINKDWDNTQIYICILEMLEGAKSNLDEIKAAWFSDIKEVTKSLGKKEKNKNFNIYNYLEEIPNHPLFLQYLGCFNYNNTNIIKKKENWKNIIFPFDSEKYTIKQIIKASLEKGNDIRDIELLFKIIWKQSFSSEYREGGIPIELTRSDKLEDILKSQKEDAYLNKNNIEDAKEKKGKKKNKKLKLEELLNNFNEIEKLSKDNQWYCTKCKEFQLADKKMEIYSVNEVIIIHLKRFRNNRKIENFVEFPIEGLDLSNYLPKKDEQYIYDLFAVANHQGGLHGGHYFAYCKNYIDGEWYEFNDSNVSKIDKKKVVSDNAYVLFYNKRREEKINEEELFKKPFIEIDYTKYN